MHHMLFVQATVLEEMPPFPERESSILAKLKKKRPEKADTVEPKDLKVAAAPPQINSNSVNDTQQHATLKVSQIIVQFVRNMTLSNGFPGHWDILFILKKCPWPIKIRFGKLLEKPQ